MDRINMSRVVMGGLLAGLVINIGEMLFNGVLFADQMDRVAARLNLQPPGGEAIVYFVLLAFALGFMAVWLYAAIRARYGAGPTTAVCAGLATWFLAMVYPSVTMGVMGIFPTSLLIYGLLWGLVEVPLATLAGAWIYREELAPSAA
jgi:hypothetical protein